MVLAGKAGQVVAEVQLSGPVTADTFVAVTSSVLGCLQITGGGVTVPAGDTAAAVYGDGVNACDSVTLTATLGAVTVTTTEPVVYPAQPALVGFEALPPIHAGHFNEPIATVTLSFPAVYDTFVSVTSIYCLPIPGGGVVVPAGATTADVLGGSSNACPSVTLTATLGTVSLTATTSVI